MIGLHWLRNLNRPVRRSARRHHAVESRCCERLENRCLLTADGGLFEFAAPQTIELPDDFHVEPFSGGFIEHGGSIFISGTVDSAAGDDVYVTLMVDEAGELALANDLIAIPDSNAEFPYFIRPSIVGGEVVFVGRGIVDNPGTEFLQGIYVSLDGTVTGLPTPNPEFSGTIIANSTILASNQTGFATVFGASRLYATSLHEQDLDYVLLPVRDNLAGTATAISEDGAFVYGEDGAGLGPLVIWRRDVDSETGEVFYTKNELQQPPIQGSGTSGYRTPSITNEYLPSEYFTVEGFDFETGMATGEIVFRANVGLWRSSDATFVRGFENGHEPYIAKHDGVNYLLYSEPDPLSDGHDMLSLYVDGADDAVPLRDFYAARNVSLATPGLGEIARVIEFSFASTGELLILGESYQPGSDELVTTFSIFPAFDSEPVAEPLSVELPGDGAEYELTVAEGDLVLRRAAGTELLRQPLGRVESLVVHGSAANDRLRVVGDVSAAEIPLTVLGAAGNDVVDLADWPGTVAVDAGAGNDLVGISVVERLSYAGGSDTDTLRLGGSGITLDLTRLDDSRLTGIEVIDITGSGDNTLTLDLAEVLNISDEFNTLLVRRNAGDTVNIGSDWTQRANETIGAGTFEVFTQGVATLKVQFDNSAPTLANAIADQNTMEASAFTFAFAASTFADVDLGDSLSFSATQSDGSELPSWLTFTAATRTFSGTPLSADVGILSVTVTATDQSHANVSETFDIAVLGTTVEVTGGVATISDVGGASNDSVGLAIVGDNFVVTIEGVTSSISIAGLTNLIINGGGGDDLLTIDLTNGPLPFNITFNGGAGGFDELIITGLDDSGTFTANYTNSSDGDIQFLNAGETLFSVTYTGLEPIRIEGTPTEAVFNLPNTADTDVMLLDIADSVDGLGNTLRMMRLSGSTFEDTDFSINAATRIVINSNGGNDRITIQSVDAAYTGTVIVDGGAGNDTLTASRSNYAVTLLGGIGNDTLTGSAFGDLLDGGAGNDSLSANAGDDTLVGGAGKDSLNGGAGTDTVVETTVDAVMTLTNAQLTGNGTDKLANIERAVLTGTARNNTLDASAFTLGNVSLRGGDGNDTLIGGAFTGAVGDNGFNDSLDGGAGTDVVRQTSRGDQSVAAGLPPGTFVVTGGSSSSGDLWRSIEGLHFIGSGSAAVTLSAELFNGSVTLAGGSGHDVLIGGRRNNVLHGNAGNDVLIGGDAADTLNGGSGNDSLVGNGGNDRLNGQAGNDTLRGNAGDDHLFGEAGSDKLFGGSGNDLLDGGAGNDVLTGEAGDDAINGGAGSDAISGGDGNDLLDGGLGSDTILGGSGDDVLRSGGGADRLAGGSGNDRFVASGSRINLGGGDDTVSGSGNTIDAVFVFDFERLLV